jgi:hypothetical protein
MRTEPPASPMTVGDLDAAIRRDRYRYHRWMRRRIARNSFRNPGAPRVAAVDARLRMARGGSDWFVVCKPRKRRTRDPMSTRE